jgi:hypothetical protein
MAPAPNIFRMFGGGLRLMQNAAAVVPVAYHHPQIGRSQRSGSGITIDKTRHPDHIRIGGISVDP